MMKNLLPNYHKKKCLKCNKETMHKKYDYADFNTYFVYFIRCLVCDKTVKITQRKLF